MARQQTYATTWQPMVDQTIKWKSFVFDEPNRIVPDHGANPLRGILIGDPDCGCALGGARRRDLVRAASADVVLKQTG